MKRSLTLAASIILLSGCGGSGSIPVSPAAQERANVPGDSWAYKVSFDIGIFGVYRGTLTETITTDTYAGAPSEKITRTFFFPDFQGVPATLTSYDELSTGGALLADMVNNTLYGVTSDTFHTPSPFAIGQTATGVITLANSQTITETYHVIGKENVSTLDGTYACWVVTQNAVNSDGTRDNFKFYIAPETGNYVEITDTTIRPDLSEYSYTAVLAARVSATTRAPQSSTSEVLPSVLLSQPLPTRAP